MLLFRPFLSHFTRKLRHTPAELEETINKCLDAAMKTIDVIYDIYRIHTFFRCWFVHPLAPCACTSIKKLIDRWYNTTYVMFATTTLLLPMSKLGMCERTIPLSRSVEMAVEILEAMDESVVARKSVDIIMHYLREFRASNNNNGTDTNDSTAQMTVMPTPSDTNVAPALVGAETVGPGPGQPGFDIPVCPLPFS